MTRSSIAALLTAIIVTCAFASARVSEIESTIPASDRIPCQLRFCCKGQVTRLESCYEVSGFASAGGIESGQLGDDIEEVAADLAARQ